MGDHQGLGVSKADVVIEAICEDVAAKQELYATLEPRLKPDAVLTGNTSSIPVQFLSQQLADPRRLVGMHFFNPVPKMPLIEIVSAEFTDPDVAIKPAPHRFAEIPADIEDRLILRLVNECIDCLREGIVHDGDLLDAGIIFGTGFAPFRGGPLHYVHAQGSKALQKRLHGLV